MNYVKKILFFNDGSEFEVSFLKEVTTDNAAHFIKNLEFLYPDLKKISSYEQQLVHTILIIKHFTDFYIDSIGIEDILEEAEELEECGALSQIVMNFDPKIVNEINELTAMYFLKHYKEIPKYLHFKGESKNIFLKNFMKHQKKEEENSISTLKIEIKLFEHKEQPTVNQLLDEYNDYGELYEKFGDESYKQRQSFILQVLKREKQYDDF